MQHRGAWALLRNMSPQVAIGTIIVRLSLLLYASTPHQILTCFTALILHTVGESVLITFNLLFTLSQLED